MTSFRQIDDPRIRQLAETLRQNGLAASETEAVRMAESMTKTESRVIKHFDEHKNGAIMDTRVSEAPKREIKITQEPPAPITQEEANHAREEEEPVQAVNPAHENSAIAEAITNVQQAYEEPAQQAPVNVELDTEKPLAEQFEEVPEPAQEEPVTVAEPVAEEKQTELPQEPEMAAPMVEEAEPVQEIQAEEEPVVSEPEVAPEPQLEEEPIVQEAPVEEAPAYEAPAEEPQIEAEPIEQAAPEPAIEAEETPSLIDDAMPQEEPAAQEAPEPVTEAPMVEETAPVEAAPAEEEQMVEKTQEIHDKPQAQESSNFAESKIDLSNVFDFSKR